MQGSAGVARSVANARNGCRVHGSRKGEAFSQSFTLSGEEDGEEDGEEGAVEVEEEVEEEIEEAATNGIEAEEEEADVNEAQAGQYTQHTGEDELMDEPGWGRGGDDEGDDD
eukprot:71209-Prorocentrum_minimum.AAC.3